MQRSLPPTYCPGSAQQQRLAQATAKGLGAPRLTRGYFDLLPLCAALGTSFLIFNNVVLPTSMIRTRL